MDGRDDMDRIGLDWVGLGSIRFAWVFLGFYKASVGFLIREVS